MKNNYAYRLKVLQRNKKADQIRRFKYKKLIKKEPILPVALLPLESSTKLPLGISVGEEEQEISPPKSSSTYTPVAPVAPAAPAAPAAAAQESIPKITKKNRYSRARNSKGQPVLKYVINDCLKKIIALEKQ